jgi:hypothetical protein
MDLIYSGEGQRGFITVWHTELYNLPSEGQRELALTRRQRAHIWVRIQIHARSYAYISKDTYISEGW